MNSPNEHGYCPHCKADLDGGDIKQTFVEQGQSEEEAGATAEQYGYGPGRTKWGRAIGIYDIGRDRTTQWECRDCKGRWGRE